MNSIKEMLQDFFDLFGKCLCIITLMLSSFLLLINLYHNSEINYKFLVDLKENEQYQNFKSSVNTLAKRVEDSNVSNKINDVNTRMVFTVTKLEFDKCFDVIKASKFYTEDKQYLSYKDMYDYNEELSSSIQSKCLFKINQTIENTLKQYKVNNISYNSYEEIVNARQNIVFYSNYLSEELLSNSNYSYMTETSRNMTFNKLSNAFTLNINNYQQVLNNLEKMVVWYETAGGLYE